MARAAMILVVVVVDSPMAHTLVLWERMTNHSPTNTNTIEIIIIIIPTLNIAETETPLIRWQTTHGHQQGRHRHIATPTKSGNGYLRGEWASRPIFFFFFCFCHLQQHMSAAAPFYEGNSQVKKRRKGATRLSCAECRRSVSLSHPQFSELTHL